MNTDASSMDFGVEPAANHKYQGAEPSKELEALFSRSGLNPSKAAATPIAGKLHMHGDQLAYGIVYQYVGHRERFDNWKFSEGNRVFDQIWTDGLFIPSTSGAFCNEYLASTIHGASYIIVFGNVYYPSDYYGDTWVSQYWLSPKANTELIYERVLELYTEASQYRR